MFRLKIVGTGPAGELTEQVHECERISTKIVPVDSVAARGLPEDKAEGIPAREPEEPGITITLVPSMVVLKLPRDGHAVFLIDDKDHTVERYRWPTKSQTSKETLDR